MCIKDIDPLRFTDYTKECCQIIAEAGEYSTDQYLVRLVRMHSLTDRIGRMFSCQENDPLGTSLSAPLGMCIRLIENELQSMKASIPPEAPENSQSHLDHNPRTFLARLIEPDCVNSVSASPLLHARDMASRSRTSQQHPRITIRGLHHDSPKHSILMSYVHRILLQSILQPPRLEFHHLALFLRCPFLARNHGPLQATALPRSGLGPPVRSFSAGPPHYHRDLDCEGRS